MNYNVILFNNTGLKADVVAISKGVYALICETGEDHIVAFGMIPKRFCDMWEASIREIIIRTESARLGCNPVELNSPETHWRWKLDEDKVGRIIGEASQLIAAGILSEARAAGKLMV